MEPLRLPPDPAWAPPSDAGKGGPPVPPPPSPPPPELDEAKRAFERAHANYLAARRLCDALAEDVVRSGHRMTAVYHEWALQHSAKALAENGGPRAPALGEAPAGGPQ